MICRIGFFAAAIVGAMTGILRAQFALQEDFNSYADDAALRAVWTGPAAAAVGNQITLTSTFDPVPALIPGTQSLAQAARFSSSSNANQFSYRPLTNSFKANQNFTITVDMVTDQYSRSLAFALTDGTGTNGYVFRINATGVNQNSGRGVALVYEHSGTSIATATDYGTSQTLARPSYPTVDANNVPIGPIPPNTGTPTASGVNGLAPVTGYSRRSGTDATTPSDQNLVAFDSTWQGMITWRLEFVDGVISIYNDSVDNPGRFDGGNPFYVGRYTDTTPFSPTMDFARFYVMGQSAYFDNITVAVPEPASAGVVGLAGALLIRRRRRVAC